jgi:hypothetical protein
MNPEHVHEHIPKVAAIGVGLGLALACGVMMGSGDFKWPFLAIAVIAVTVFLLLVERRIWMLIPATWMLAGKMSVLPVPLTIANLGVLIAFAVYLALKAFKKVRLKPKMGTTDVWMLIMLCYLATVYVRNPVGVEAFGSDRVGGRPYIDIIIAFCGCWVLSRTVAAGRDLIILPFLGIAGHAFHAFTNFIAYRVPSTVGPLSQLYSGISAANETEAIVSDEGGRLAYLQGVGASATSIACSFWRPFTLINPLNFWRYLLFKAGLIAVLLSGFRSGIFGVIEMFILGSYFRRGWSDVFKAMALAGAGLGILALLQGNVVNLPLSAQRALSFLPGKWDYTAKAEAADSSEWRFTMWKAMLNENKYIENKWLGDGFGFTHRQLEIMAANSLHGSNADQQENLMISGGVHSGPISTIRYVGYVGLLIFLILLVLIARRALQLIRRARNTPYFSIALMYNMPVVVLPFNFVFIFGAFENELANAIFIIGLQKMLENSLDAHFLQEKKSSPETIQPPRSQHTSRYVPAGSAR